MLSQLYLDGKIEQWYTRSDGKGAVLFLRCKTVDEAKAIFAELPVVKAGYLDVEYIPVGPFSRIASFDEAAACGGGKRAKLGSGLEGEFPVLTDEVFAEAVVRLFGDLGGSLRAGKGGERCRGCCWSRGRSCGSRCDGRIVCTHG